MNTTVGIPTDHAGQHFRSRLEARWAAFFDLIGWRWTYEPLDADGYIPDFLIHGKRPLFVEVGPCITRDDYERKTEKPDRVAATLGHDVLIVGVSPLPDIESDGAEGWLGVAGLLGEGFGCLPDCAAADHGFLYDEAGELVIVDGAAQPDPRHEPASYSWAAAIWAGAGEDGRPDLDRWDHGLPLLGVAHAVQSYSVRPHDWYDGGHMFGWTGGGAHTLERLWREAGNRTQWRP